MIPTLFLILTVALMIQKPLMIPTRKKLKPLMILKKNPNRIRISILKNPIQTNVIRL